MQLGTISTRLRPRFAIAVPTLTLQLLGLMEITDFNVKIRAWGNVRAIHNGPRYLAGPYVSIFGCHVIHNDWV